MTQYSAFIERLLSQPNEASTRRLLHALGIGTDTDSIPEGTTNLYFTDARAQNALAPQVTTVAAGPYAITAVRGVIAVIGNTAGGSFTITLPTAVGNKATLIISKMSAANQLTVDAAGSETIAGGLTAVLNYDNEAIILFSDGANWRIT